MRALRRFVASGGSLVATFATSLYDEWGAPRKDFGLADVLGIRYQGKISYHLNISGRSWGFPGGPGLEIFRPLLYEIR